jgi:hypothetical protein
MADGYLQTAPVRLQRFLTDADMANQHPPRTAPCRSPDVPAATVAVHSTKIDRHSCRQRMVSNHACTSHISHAVKVVIRLTVALMPCQSVCQASWLSPTVEHWPQLPWPPLCVCRRRATASTSSLRASGCVGPAHSTRSSSAETASHRQRYAHPGAPPAAQRVLAGVERA